MMNQSEVPGMIEFMRVGDHPALDFLNTLVRVAGSDIDLLQSDGDVVRWLAQAGLPIGNAATTLPSHALLDAARALREAVRDLVEKRKSGQAGDFTRLNAYLAQSRSSLLLVEQENESPKLTRQWSQLTAGELLAPLAESAAALLADGDFDLIRRCESDECVLWFYDRTKSHQRRWCSMANCGNRHKVAAFRKRKQQSAS
jgi:predicted RNA-binding Zn ribbon-like protein